VALPHDPPRPPATRCGSPLGQGDLCPPAPGPLAYVLTRGMNQPARRCAPLMPAGVSAGDCGAPRAGHAAVRPEAETPQLRRRGAAGGRRRGPVGRGGEVQSDLITRRARLPEPMFNARHVHCHRRLIRHWPRRLVAGCRGPRRSIPGVAPAPDRIGERHADGHAIMAATGFGSALLPPPAQIRYKPRPCLRPSSPTSADLAPPPPPPAPPGIPLIGPAGRLSHLPMRPGSPLWRVLL